MLQPVVSIELEPPPDSEEEKQAAARNAFTAKLSEKPSRRPMWLALGTLGLAAVGKGHDQIAQQRSVGGRHLDGDQQQHQGTLRLATTAIELTHALEQIDAIEHVVGDHHDLDRLCAVRGEDVAARIGGEEFAVMLPEAGLDDARAFAERLREAVASATFVLGGEPQRLTISIGIASLAPGRGDRSALMKAADAALYRAKDEGRNRVCVEA